MFPQDGSQNTYGAPTTVDGFFVKLWGNHLSLNICLLPQWMPILEPCCPPAWEHFPTWPWGHLPGLREGAVLLWSALWNCTSFWTRSLLKIPWKIHSWDPPGPPGSCVSASSHLARWGPLQKENWSAGQRPGWSFQLSQMVQGMESRLPAILPCHLTAGSWNDVTLHSCPPSLIYAGQQLSLRLASGRTFRGCCLGRYVFPRWLWEQGCVLLPPGVLIFEGCVLFIVDSALQGNKRSR